MVKQLSLCREQFHDACRHREQGQPIGKVLSAIAASLATLCVVRGCVLQATCPCSDEVYFLMSDIHPAVYMFSENSLSSRLGYCLSHQGGPPSSEKHCGLVCYAMGQRTLQLAGACLYLVNNLAGRLQARSLRANIALVELMKGRESRTLPTSRSIYMQRRPEAAGSTGKALMVHVCCATHTLARSHPLCKPKNTRLCCLALRCQNQHNTVLNQRAERQL